MTVRPMAASDEPAVLEVVATLSDWFDDDARNRSIPIDLRHHMTFVADDAGRVVGFISLHVFNGRLDISWMGVRNECRGRGIGTRLLDRAEELGRAWGLHEITTFTLGDTVDYEPYEFTRRFYLRNGFEVYQRNQTDNPGCPEEWRLKKRIT
jgi:GNAT superfamily N-acetyltransferase